MHIEPGVVNGAKLILSYATAAGGLALAVKMAASSLRLDGGVAALTIRSILTTGLVSCFFEILPKHPVGVSEVHFILGSTLLLLFGAGAASIGLAFGLLLQGLLIAPFDLPQYGMNVTTLLVPLWGVHLLAKKIIPERTAYVDVSFRQALALSTTYQGGIVAWVAFWAFYGQGFSYEILVAVGLFGSAYVVVILLEPVIDLGVLAFAKVFHKYSSGSFFNSRLHRPAA